MPLSGCRLFIIALFYTVFIFSSIASADENKLKIRGYIKTLATIYDFTGYDFEQTGSNNTDIPDLEGSLISTLRVSLLWQPEESVSAELAYEIVPRIQDDILESFFRIQAANPLSYRAFDFGEKIDVTHDTSSFRLFQNLDRAFITFSPPFADIHAGRQPIAFGSARVVNPTDIFTSFTYTELNKEERTGVDAIRIKIPAGMLGEVDIGTVFGEKFKSYESAAFVRTKFFLFETDLSAISILFKENLLLGFDIARSIGGAGYWFEGAYTFSGITDNRDTDQDYVRVSTGIDYSLTDKLYAYVEYHYNSAGETDPGDYKIIGAKSKETAYEEGSVYLHGKHYIAPGFTYNITPIFTFSAQSICNIGDSSLLFFPDFQYSLSDNAVLEAGAFIGIGSGPDIMINSDTGGTYISAHSEFGLYPDTYFISVRLYF